MLTTRKDERATEGSVGGTQERPQEKMSWQEIPSLIRYLDSVRSNLEGMHREITDRMAESSRSLQEKESAMAELERKYAQLQKKQLQKDHAEARKEDNEEEIRDRLRNEIRDELRSEIRNEIRDELRNELRSEIRDRHRDEVEALQDKITRLETEAREREQEPKERRGEEDYNDIVRKMRVLEDENKDLTELLSQREAELMQRQQEHAQSQRDLKQTRETLAQREAEYVRLEQTHALCQQTQAQYQRAQEKLQQQKEQELAQREQELTICRNRIQNAENNARAERDNAAIMKKEFAEERVLLNERNKHSTRQLEAMLTTANEEKRKNAALEQNFLLGKEQHEALTQKYNAMMHEGCELYRQFEAAKEEHAREISSLSQTFETFRQDVETVNVLALKNENETLKTEVQKQNAELTKLAKDVNYHIKKNKKNAKRFRYLSFLENIASKACNADGSYAFLKKKGDGYVKLTYNEFEEIIRTNPEATYDNVEFWKPYLGPSVLKAMITREV